MITISIPAPAHPSTVSVVADGQPIGGLRMILIEGERVQMHFHKFPEEDEAYDAYAEILRNAGVQVFRNEWLPRAG